MVMKTFSVPKDVRATQVAVVGDFNDWSTERHLMRPCSEGGFTLSIDLEPGRLYHYRYLIDRERWENDGFADAYAPGRFGGNDSIVDLRASCG
jgi:1,4-alpha-glucan branching enzyme